MKYKPYPKYKDSGVEWLGEIPEGWVPKKLKYGLGSNDGGAWGEDPKGDESDCIVLRSTEQNVDGTWNILEPAYRSLSKKEFEATRLITGDLLVTKSSGSTLHIGKTSLVSPDIASLGCSYSNFMQRLRTHEKLLPKFVWYILNNNIAREQFNYLSNSTIGLSNLNSTVFNDLLLSFPPLPTQRAIATFLDTETTRIDGLIKDYEDLIELLKEKRQALISHAVTRGLSELVDPDDPEFGEWAKPVKFKDSGVEWIGEIPEGWVISKIGYQATFSSGATPSKDNDSYWNGEIPWVSPKDMKVQEIWDSEDHVSDEAVRNSTLKLVPIDALLIVVRGMILIRDFPVAITKKPLTINQDMKALQVNKCMNPRYLFAFLIGIKNRILTFYIDEAAHGTLAIRMDIFKGLPVIVPSTSDQQAIAKFLDRETAKMDLLVSEVESAIELLKEHRSALITNAVTGKINVENIA